MSDQEYSQKVHNLNTGAAKSWNTVYKPIFEKSISFGLSLLKGGLDALTGRDILSASNKDGFTFATKPLNPVERAWSLVSPLAGKVVEKAASGTGMFTEFSADALWSIEDKLISDQAGRYTEMDNDDSDDDGLRFYEVTPGEELD